MLGLDFLEVACLLVHLVPKLINQGLIVGYDVQKDYFLLVHVFQGIFILLSGPLVACTEVPQAGLVTFFEIVLFLS